MINITQDIDFIVIADDDPLLKLKPNWESTTGIGLLLNKRGNTEGAFFKKNKLLRLKSVGYLDDGIDDSAALPAVSRLKCALYLGALIGVFKHEPRPSPWGGKPSSSLLFTDETAPSGFVSKVEFPHETSSYIAGYELTPATDEAALFARKKALGQLSKLLESDDRDPNKIPIITAAEWAFDSAASTNQTVSFIQLCVALEAVLGDENTKEGLTRTLADRAAYLIGQTVSQRASIRKRFEQLYNHRSKLVHGRRVHLEKEAEDSLHWGRDLLNIVLRRELKNFSPTEKK